MWCWLLPTPSLTPNLSEEKEQVKPRIFVGKLKNWPCVPCGLGGGLLYIYKGNKKKRRTMGEGSRMPNMSNWHTWWEWDSNIHMDNHKPSSIQTGRRGGGEEILASKGRHRDDLPSKGSSGIIWSNKALALLSPSRLAGTADAQEHAAPHGERCVISTPNRQHVILDVHILTF